ncbi:Hsp20/alpha crystallin family protein [Peredibacter sp. HCB2-198]|uniref:Hsp20/alpha crystallin family protein n=1 Tax=Peredibacter sp. HCB2-198 TaxID=3383025 RepID=UPI0038B52380
MYHFELKPNRTHNQWEREFEKLFDVFSKEDLYAPACEILDEEKSYSISLDIPGATKEDINIEVKDNHLYISGERKYHGKTDKDYVLRSERRYGKFSRVFSLPKNVNPDAIEARFENGVLDLTLPKEEKSQTRKIAISDWSKAGTELKS